MKRCSKCRIEHNGSHRYCAPCFAAYQREWRKTHPLSEESRKRDNCRSYASVYKRRGILRQNPCEHCGDPKSQMHHIDHELPLDVTWLCRPCHLAWHSHWRNVIRETFLAWLIKKPEQKSERAA